MSDGLTVYPRKTFLQTNTVYISQIFSQLLAVITRVLLALNDDAMLNRMCGLVKIQSLLDIDMHVF